MAQPFLMPAIDFNFYKQFLSRSKKLFVGRIVMSNVTLPA